MGLLDSFLEIAGSINAIKADMNNSGGAFIKQSYGPYPPVNTLDTHYTPTPREMNGQTLNCAGCSYFKSSGNYCRARGKEVDASGHCDFYDLRITLDLYHKKETGN